MKIMSSEMKVFFIHIDTCCSGEKSNSMPFPSGSSFRYIKPVVFSSSVVAISTEKTCTPDLVTISSGWKVAACASKPDHAKAAATATTDIQSHARTRCRNIFRSKLMGLRSPWEFACAGPYPNDHGKCQTPGKATQCDFP